MIPNSGSFTSNTSCTKFCLAYPRIGYVMGSSGRLPRSLDLENVFHVIRAQIIQGLTNFYTEVSHPLNFDSDRSTDL